MIEKCNEYAYGRVSYRTQNLDRQVEQFLKLGIPEKHIYLDKCTGKDFERTSYKRCIRKLKEGDVLFVHSIKRLGRNYEEILEQWEYITKIKKVDIVVLDMTPVLDTRMYKDLIGTFISDMVLRLLSFVAEEDWNDIKIAQKQGIESAKKRGVKFGRPRLMELNEFSKRYKELMGKGLSDDEIGLILGLSKTTLYRYKKNIQY